MSLRIYFYSAVMIIVAIGTPIISTIIWII